MDSDDLRAWVAEGPIVADGGMGTALIAAGAPVGSCLEDLNVDAPDLVEAVHRSFVQAGASMVLTNTFGANRFRLEEHGATSGVDVVNAAGVELARRSGADVVAGSMGPLGIRLAPYGRVGGEDAREAYRSQVAALASAGVDLVVVETQTDLREMEHAVAAVRDAAPGLALAVSATFTRDDRTLLGSTPEQVATRLVALDVDAIGVNCGEGPAQVSRIVETMVRFVGDRPLIARPNAGGPLEIGGRFVYPATPGYMGEQVGALIERGVSIVGGCCGTGPDHTAAIVAARARSTVERPPRSKADGPAMTDSTGVVTATTPSPAPVASGPEAVPTHLQTVLAEGRFAVAVEMEPPRSWDAATLVAAAQTVHEAGADVVDVADSPMARMRMSAWAACRRVQEQARIETVLHFPTRGRNLLRLQGDLLGAYALGIRNLFVCVGDPVSIGEYPQAFNDVDVTATGLLSLITQEFNRGRDRRGSSIGEATAFFAGAALAPEAADLAREVRLTDRKVRAGASFFLSQPIYSVEPLRRFLEAFEAATGGPLSVPVLVGVLPLASARHAEFLHNEVPGISIPEPVRSRMDRAGDDGWRAGVKLAEDLMVQLREAGAAGVYVMPQFGRFDVAAEVVEAARR